MTDKYTPQQIAEWFLCNIDRNAGDAITHLRLQKLVYYAQAWSLVLLEKPLFDEDCQAWAHGPVYYSLFDTYRGNGWEALDAPEECPNIDTETEKLLEEVLAIYGQKSAKYLERLTHSEAPWKNARGDLSPEASSQSIIPKEAIEKFYTELYENAANG